MVAPRFAHCPHCNGFGATMTTGGKTVRCPHCHAAHASIMLFDDDLIIWKQPYDEEAVSGRRLRRTLGRLFDGICFVNAVVGIVALLIVIHEVNAVTDSVVQFFFDQSAARLVFWISAVTDLWLFARIEQAVQQRQPIRPFKRLRTLNMEPVTDWALLERMVPKLAVDASHYVTRDAERVIDQSVVQARFRSEHTITPAHLLSEVIRTTSGKAALYRLQLSHDDVMEGLQRVAKYEQHHGTARFNEALLLAYVQARASRRPSCGPLELFVGCVKADERLSDLFDELGVTVKEIQHVVHWGNIVHDLLQRERRRRHLAQAKPKTTMNRAMTARPTYTLDSTSQDFTLLARSNHFLPPIGRDNEVAEAFRVLQEDHSSVLLVGEAGVGKTTIFEGIAQLMAAEDVPGPLQDKRLVVTNPGSLIAGAGAFGGIEGRMQSIIYEIIQAGNVIWGIEDIHSLLGAGSTSSNIDIGKILMNYISQGYIKVIGTTTTREFEKYIEPQETFARRFQIVRIPELGNDDSILVLEGRAPFVEGKYNVFFTYQALADCVHLTQRYIKERHLPAKAIDVMEEAAVLAREKVGGKMALVTKDHVAHVMAQKTNVAVTTITASETEKLLNLEAVLHERVIGQDEAIVAIARALRRAREDVRDVNRPIASLLFLGPTGVGKTETAKAIAAVYFGSEERLTRFDMSEYQTVESIERLIGSSKSPGLLTEAIRQTPFSIVLLDELEKAHRDVLNVFLQVMEDGRLTDGSGRTADFTNAMLIATSNAATPEIERRYKDSESTEQIHQAILEGDLLKQWFSPEFLNRFDHIVVFTPLTLAELVQIAELLLGRLAQKLLEKGIQLRWTAEAVSELVQIGYHPQYGARPLRRAIQDTVQDALAQVLLKEKIGRRDIVELQRGGKLTIIKAEKI